MKSLLSFKEACKHLDLPESTLRKLTSKKVIAHYKPSHKRVYYNVKDLDAYMMRNKVSTDAQDMAASDFVFNRKRKTA